MVSATSGVFATPFSSRATQRVAELQDLLQPMLEELAANEGYERTFVILTSEDKTEVVGAFGVNVPYDLLEPTPDGTDRPRLFTTALTEGRMIRVEDVLRDPQIPESLRARFVNHNMLSFAVVPLQPVSGVLYACPREKLSDAQVNRLLPYAGKLIASLEGQQTARRLEESGLQQASTKEWLNWMINSMQDPVLLSDESNNLILQNIAAERVFKTRPDDSEGKRRAIELNSFLLSAVLSSFALDGGIISGRELTLVDPIEGTELLYEVICQPATNLVTGERGLVSVLKNVTDLRHAADEVRRSLEAAARTDEEIRSERDRLNLILAHVADPIVVTDVSSEIILMNPSAERLLQSPGTSQSDRLAYATNDAKLTSFLSRLGLEAAPVLQGELQLVEPRSGETLTMSLTATEVRDELGQVAAVVSVLHDLTKLRELERRTLEQQLFESEKLAAVGRLAAAIAHEINNPLEAIKNSLHVVVSSTPKDDPNLQFLQIADKETQRVSGIIRQMLGLYRPGSTPSPTDVNLVIKDVLALLERQLKQHGVNLTSHLDDRLPQLTASSDPLKQVFLNLLLNAESAVERGGEVDISSRLSNEEDPEFLSNDFVLVQVRDNGKGIAPEHLHQIFDPFFSTKTEQKGTGIGLWVSLSIVKQHGGQLLVKSTPGKGALFTVALPIGS